MVARLVRSLSEREPSRMVLERNVRRAAVALILRVGEEADSLELLMIKRAEYESDPWSGHIALPGGREEPGDLSLEETVIRETCEETALDLARDGRVLGRLDDIGPRSTPLPRIIISPFVVAYGEAGVMRLSNEIAEAFWVPVDALRDPQVSHEIVLELTGGARRVPCFEYEGRIIWGLTERILRQFLELMG